MRYLSIDIETLGLDDNYCDVIEFAGVLDHLNPQQDCDPIDTLPCFHTYITQPFDRYRGEAFAMSMHSKILRRIAERESGYLYTPADCLGSLIADFLKENDAFGKITLAGKNIGRFDLMFLTRLSGFKENVRWHHRILDVGSMFVRPEDEYLPSLETCLERAGYNKSVAHNAKDDALDVIRCVRFALRY